MKVNTSRADHVWLSLYFSIQSDFFFYIHMVPSISNVTLVNHNSVSLGCHHHWQVHQSICEKWAVQMGGVTKRSFISAYFLLSTYFLTTQSYKRMRLTTRVYGIITVYLYAYYCIDNSKDLGGGGEIPVLPPSVCNPEGCPYRGVPPYTTMGAQNLMVVILRI